MGTAGGGGEYDVQTGFGWTNGVVIDFMATFGDEVMIGHCHNRLNEIEIQFHNDIKLCIVHTVEAA
jgi:hypothetical protein